ncbi:MAG: IS1182 family transposase [Acidobacteriota bacterium]
MKRPRLKAIDRKQMCLCPIDVDNLIDQDHPARLIWEFVGQLDLSQFHEEIRAFEGQAGRSALDPQLLISLWIYGYSLGVGTAREISRLCDYHPAFQWLTGMQSINYHTLSDFRISHKEKLDDLFKQILAVLQSQGIVDLRRVFHDGSKIKANASSGSFHRKQTIEADLQLAEEVIKQQEKEDCQQQSKRSQAAKENAARRRKETLQKALEEFKKLPEKTKRNHQTRVSQTDPDARNMIIAGGGYAPAYNAQLTTEGKNGFIVAAQIAQSSSDAQQLQPAIEKIIENTAATPQQMVADSGFTNKNNIIKLMQHRIQMIGPLLPQSSTVEQLEKRGIDPGFGKDAFQFDPQNNQYICPAGKGLRYVSSRKGKASIEHSYRAAAIDCRTCQFKVQCCGKMKRVQRQLIRTEDLPEVASFKKVMETEEARNIYKQRAQFAEFPLAWIKEKFGLRRFHVRGQDKTLMELLWVSLTFNVLWFLRIKSSIAS